MANRPQSNNPWGKHTDWYFEPADDTPLRCHQCNNPFDTGFCYTGQCPNCNWHFTKKDARNMSIEAAWVKMRHGGWTRAVLDDLEAKEKAVATRKDGIRELRERDINAMALYLKDRERSLQAERRRKNAEARMIGALRSKTGGMCPPLEAKRF